MKIVMLEPLIVSKVYIEELSEKLINLGHEFKACYKNLTNDEKLETARDADVIIITNSILEEEVLKVAPKLKLISVGFTGIDHIPINYCKDNNIIVSNSQGYATIPTAELAITLMLMRTRNVIETDSRCRDGKTKEGLVGYELTNKTVGIVGTGMIGRQVAKMLSGFNVNLLGYSRTENKDALELGIKYTSLEYLFKKSDFISLHVPLSDSTKGMINRELISLMKEDAILINCARGQILDSDALVDALNNNKIRGAGIDVYEVEPPLENNNKYSNASNLYMTPHIGFATIESMQRRAKIVFDNIYAYLNEVPINVKIQ